MLGAALTTNFLPLLACAPIHDLDAVRRGSGSGSGGSASGGGGLFGGSPGSAGSPSAGMASGGKLDTTAGAGSKATAGASGTSNHGGAANGGRGNSQAGRSGGETSAAGSPQTSGGQASVSGADGGAATSGGAGFGASSSGGATGAGGATTGGFAGAAAGSSSGGDAAALPIDLPDNPVSGTFVVSSDATWEVNGDQLPAFEIHTPTASYWVVKALGEIVSIVDAGGADARQWIDFSSGFRPARGLPSYVTFGSTETMTTTLDGDSQTPTHLRLFSASPSWRIVWDFYPTHVTLTINGAPLPYGMAYRGVPGGSLDANDRFVLGDGTAQSAMTSSVADWTGPAEWAYVTDPTIMRSLFAIHHGDDALVDRYQVKDNDSAMISFGDGKLSELPQRFSFGVVDSSDYQVVKGRAQFVIGAIH